ncbi:MAG TPA: class I adenylate-forming enzyme family protein [Steroidobacteraceae bacterium]|nr:class I adenylate-forming enzyme family protein [Steroidobacteraceae bacterium]
MTEDEPIDSTSKGPPLADEPLGALTLGGFLREVCARHGRREALVFHPAGGPVIRRSYAQVWDEALAVAQALLARGVTKETRVGLMVTNRPEWVSALFGIALAGGTVVVMSTFATPAELEYQLRMGDVSLLIFERHIVKRDVAAELLALCPQIGTAADEIRSNGLPFLRRVVCIDDAGGAGGAIESWSDFLRPDRLAAASLVEAICSEIAPTDRALIFFSSGSTARPKAILHMHRAAAIQCWRWRRVFGLDPDVRTWTANGFFWVGNFAMAVGATFAAGGCLVLQRLFVAGEALRLMQEERVSKLLAWPHQWARLVEDPFYPSADLSALHYVPLCSPLRAHPTVKTDWNEPLSAYGSTETLSINTIFPSQTAPELYQGNHGLPCPGNTIRIVDPLTGAVLPRGQSGEIAVKGPTLMLGYLRVPPENVFDEEGFFHTGDGGFVDDQGRLHWHGRLNDIIKTGGANVSPHEIDAVLAMCPGVKIAATVGVPHDTLGELVVACIVTEAGAGLDEASIRAFAARSLSSYKVPRRVVFLAESEVALTGSNKVKTAALRELAARRLA